MHNSLHIRPFFVKPNINKRCAGSAYVETDLCKVSAEVHGPSITGKRLDNKESLNIN